MTEAARPRRSAGKALLLTVPILLWTLLIFSPVLRRPGPAVKIAVAMTAMLVVAMFFQMMRTGETYRWRRIFFVSLGVLFPVGFVWELIAVRGSMSIPIERMVSGDTPFCFMVIPMIIVPAALTRTIIFPGSILPTSSNGAGIATMIALWLAATLILGKGWCAYGCFFGGIEEGFAAIARKARVRDIPARWRLVPWGVLAAIVLLSAATFEPTYCMWLCPFKTVTEFVEVTTLKTAIQTGIFLALFFGLVVVLPVLTKKRTQCAYFCPFGAFQSIFNKTSIFEVRVDRASCANCVSCSRACPTAAIDKESIAGGGTRISCMKCGACVDVCHKDAALWHIKGTAPDAPPERARLLYLYGAWAFAAMFGGSIMAGSLEKLVGLFV